MEDLLSEGTNYKSRLEIGIIIIKIWKLVILDLKMIMPQAENSVP